MGESTMIDLIESLVGTTRRALEDARASGSELTFFGPESGLYRRQGRVEFADELIRLLRERPRAKVWIWEWRISDGGTSGAGDWAALRRAWAAESSLASAVPPADGETDALHRSAQVGGVPGGPAYRALTVASARQQRGRPLRVITYRAVALAEVG